MDFAVSREDQEFREQLRAFLKREIPADWPMVNEYDAHLSDEGDRIWKFVLGMRKKLADTGWLTMAWPREDGGQGASPMRQTIYAEEMTYCRAPGHDIQGIHMVGPMLMTYGTNDQRKKYLGRIARGDIVWCQGFSEPNAGSDLAALETRAFPDRDEYVINGRKIWTSWAHRADFCHLLARTGTPESRHKGISYFLVDMKSPGITAKPIYNLTGRSHFCQVTFEDVRVPLENMIGQKNRGWYVAQATLSYERSGIRPITEGRRVLDDLVELVKAGFLSMNENSRAVMRHKLANAEIELSTARLLSYRVAYLQTRGILPTFEVSISKILGTEALQRVVNTGMEILGLYAPLKPESKYVKLYGWIERLYQMSLCATIAGGSSQVQRNIIASRGLGLPHDKVTV